MYNIFILSGDNFFQVNGTIMSTKRAPFYANVFMG